MGKEGAVAEVERDGEEIAAEVYAEMDKADQDDGADPKGEGSTPKKDEKKAGETDDNEDGQGEGTQDGEGAKADGEKADEGSDDDKSDEDEEKSEDKGTEDQDKKITEYAEKHKMTYTEAKDDLEKTEEILKQYKNDPAEMAKAMRNKDREYQKLRGQIEKETAKKEPVFKRMTEDQFRDFARKKVAEMPDYIEKYRQKFPARSESMSDEAVIEEVVERELIIYNEKAGQKEQGIKESASTKRNELIASIPEGDRRFIPEIKALLFETPDETVVTEGFNIQDALYWAKGKAYDADMKAAEERAMKRLRENPEIIGVKGGGSGKPSSQRSVGLSKAQKDRAVEMFGADYEADRCYDMFKDAYKDELKKNPNFDPYKD